MKRVSLLLLLSGTAFAQFTAPGITISTTPTPPQVYGLAQSVTVQPARPVTQLAPARTTGILSFSLLSPTATQVLIEPNDPRLVQPGTPGTPVTLNAYAERTVSLVALAPHAGTVTLKNTAGAVLATIPYVVAPAKTVNQGLNLNYSPTGNRVGVSYSVSGVQASPLDPRWSASVSASFNISTNTASSNVSLGINW